MRRKIFTNLADAAQCAIDFSREDMLFALIVKKSGVYIVDNFSSPIEEEKGEEFIAFYEDGELVNSFSE